MKSLAILLVRCYQRFISPVLPPTCRFRPTCSAYAIEAFRRKGFVRGLALTLWRVLRCNPLCRGGYDPLEAPQTAPPAQREEVKSEELAGAATGLSRARRDDGGDGPA